MYQPVQFSFRKLSVLVLLLSFIVVSVQPAWAEDFNFPGLSGTVTVYEDQYGIPTIKGDSELDVVFVQGYIHARDRFFQMDSIRKGVAGRATELLGQAALSSDVQFRNIGLGRAAQATWQAFDAEIKGLLQAYANGVNAWLANNPLPPEYTVLELTRTDPWTPLDSVLVGKGLAAELSLELDDIDRTIKLGTYQGFGAAIGFDGVALFFEDTHRSAPPDDRVTAPDFLGGTGVAQSETAAAASGDQTSQKIKSTGSLEISDSTLSRKNSGTHRCSRKNCRTGRK